MPALDDPNQIPYPRPDDSILETIIKPITVLLRDGETVATLYPFFSPEEVPEGLMQYLSQEFNDEIERGDTYPLIDSLDLDTFRHYWFGSFAAVLLIGDSPVLPQTDSWPEKYLGTFYVKPNYPGRCSHVCNAGFLVNSAIRGKGIGKTLGELYLKWAPQLGYTYSVFNLVFETNQASIRIWDGLGFERIGKIKGAGRLKGFNEPVTAIMFGKDLTIQDKPLV
ncbi:Spt10p [Sugiyamaella lignohabitans]|uniref:Spt10p n=1 Tax=Sugiyamaella lignohabitans TaxID=796027 RepID=A0A167FP40_9ASCO|nr:Spt10p [Sugiyamaella lignohabitans]ANB15532.1 Spt10p [Sugiyamaella lignohabitans]